MNKDDWKEIIVNEGVVIIDEYGDKYE